MTNAIVTPTGTTDRIDFFKQGRVPAMFDVREGLPIHEALNTAGALTRSIQDLSLKGLMDGETSADTAYLVWFASQAVEALIQSTIHEAEFGHLRDRPSAEAEA